MYERMHAFGTHSKVYIFDKGIFDIHHPYSPEYHLSQFYFNLFCFYFKNLRDFTLVVLSINISRDHFQITILLIKLPGEL